MVGPKVFALCSLLSALCSLLSAPRSLPPALCPLPSALRVTTLPPLVEPVRLGLEVEDRLWLVGATCPVSVRYRLCFILFNKI